MAQVRHPAKQNAARRGKRGSGARSGTNGERAAVLSALHPLVKVIGGIAGPNVEVVLHDLLHPERSVVAIANGHISNRTIGSSIISGPKDDKAFAAARRELSVRGKPVHSVIEGYTTMTADGKRLKSSTVILRDSKGEPFAALCLNADLAIFQLVHAWLERFLDTKPETPDARIDAPEIGVLVNDIITEAIRLFGKPVAMMTKEEKMHAVRSMMHRGLFIIKGGVERAATALGVSRFTIYNYLEELRSRKGIADISMKTDGKGNGSVKAESPSKKKPRRSHSRTA